MGRASPQSYLWLKSLEVLRLSNLISFLFIFNKGNLLNKKKDEKRGYDSMSMAPPVKGTG